MAQLTLHGGCVYEDRLEHLEQKPNVWLDRIIQLVLGGVISAIVAAVMTGKIG